MMGASGAFAMIAVYGLEIGKSFLSLQSSSYVLRKFSREWFTSVGPCDIYASPAHLQQPGEAEKASRLHRAMHVLAHAFLRKRCISPPPLANHLRLCHISRFGRWVVLEVQVWNWIGPITASRERQFPSLEKSRVCKAQVRGYDWM